MIIPIDKGTTKLQFSLQTITTVLINLITCAGTSKENYRWQSLAIVSTLDPKSTAEELCKI